MYIIYHSAYWFDSKIMQSNMFSNEYRWHSAREEEKFDLYLFGIGRITARQFDTIREILRSPSMAKWTMRHSYSDPRPNKCIRTTVFIYITEVRSPAKPSRAQCTQDHICFCTNILESLSNPRSHIRITTGILNNIYSTNIIKLLWYFIIAIWIWNISWGIQ